MIAVGMGGMMPGRIPWRAVDQWAERYGITGADFEFLTRALSVMDAVLINHTGRGSDGV
jgi:hypothetical protein